jgi:hypothetical protein
MPGFDGTGPGGQGPMTGGGFGYCSPATRRRWLPMRGYRAPYSPYPGQVYGPGRGGLPRGRGFGGGRGCGWRCW